MRFFWFCLVWMGVVLAHAEYRSSIPIAGATLKTAPRAVTINFSQAVEVRLSTFKVYPLSAPPEAWGSSTRLKRLARPLVQQVLSLRNDGSRRVDTGVTTTKRTSKTVVVGLKPNLAPGPYVVMWKNLGVDGHAESDYYIFVYKP